MPITSSRNALLQEVRKAAASGRPTSEGLIVAEGPHLAEEALRGRWAVEQVLVAETFHASYSELTERLQAEVIEVSDRAFEFISTTERPQGIIALLRPPAWTWNDLDGVRPLLVVLDAVQDPGNAGTIVRSAEAFGATGVVMLRGSVRVANGKLLRAAAGSAFRVPLLENVPADVFVQQSQQRNLAIYALTAAGTADLSETDLAGAVALVLGSEGAGVSQEMQRCAVGVRIPVISVESLNVGIAGSIALFEAARQRRSAP